MSEYILIIAWIGIMAIFAKYVKVQKAELVCGKEETRYHWLFAFFVFLPIIIMVGTRSNIYDTWAYRNTYIQLPTNFSELFEYLKNVDKDTGFYYFSGFLKIVFKGSDIFYFFVLAAIQGISVLSVFRKYSYNYILSVFLFLASTDYLAWMYNGVRQFLAVTIIFAATTLLIKKKYIPLMLIIILASTIHLSALLMIPFAFIVQGQAWNKRTLFFILAILVALFFIGNFTSLLNGVLLETQYSSVVKENIQLEDNGTNPLRALLYAIPTILALFCRRKIQEAQNPLINICVNMSIVSTGFYILSVFTTGILMGRIPIYFSLYNYILLPWEINTLFDKKWRPLAYFVLVIVYLIFYFYQAKIMWQLF